MLDFDVLIASVKISESRFEKKNIQKTLIMALASIEKLHEISVTIFILSNIHSSECVSILFIMFMVKILNI